MRSFLSNKSFWLVLLVTAIGVFFRFQHLGLKSLVDDEADYWVWVMQMTRGEAVSPDLYMNVFLVLASLVARFVASEVGLRSIAALAGSLSTPFFYVLARQFIGRTPALGAALLFAVSPALVGMSQEFREFSLALLFTICIFLFFVLYWRTKKRLHLALFTLFTVLGFLTHVVVAIPVAALGAYVAIVYLLSPERRDREQLAGFAFYAAVVFLCMLFVYFFAYAGLADYGREEFLDSGYYWDGSLASAANLVFANTFDLITWHTVDLRYLWLFLLVVGLLHLRWGRQTRTLFAIVVGSWLITLLFAFLKLYPFVGAHRYNFYLVPAVFLLVAFGLHQFYRWNPKAFFSAILISAVVLATNSWLHISSLGSSEIRPIVEYLCSQVEDGDHIFVPTAPRPQFLFYWEQCDTSKNVSLFEQNASLGDAVSDDRFNTWLVFSHMNNTERLQIFSNMEQFTLRKAERVFEAPGSFLYLVPQTVR